MDSLSKAYITDKEIDFIRSFMWENTGTILEVGAYVGKTFYNLYKHRPNWEYVAVDAWESRPFPMTDPNIPYDHTAKEPLVHSKYFKENCPFAYMHVSDYENILFTNDTFDVIILSAASQIIDFRDHYYKAIKEVKPDGIIIGRYMNHKKYGDAVKDCVNRINPDNYMEYNESMFAIW